MSDSTVLKMRKFVAPEFVFGSGAMGLVGRYARNMGARKALLVTDPGVAAAGWVGPTLAKLHQEKVEGVVFDQVTPNPRVYEVMAGAAMFAQERCDSLVAVGGGSPMDCAKGIGVVVACGGHITDYEGVDLVTHPIPPLICIPTTSGSGADVSQFAVLSDPSRKVKMAIVSKALVPDAALIDPVTTTTMDPHLTACTAMDALTHAIEAYVSTACSPITDLHALAAIRLMHENLAPAMGSLGNLELRGRLMLASLEAGMAFSNAILGAVHAMAHSLGGLLDLSHGEADALLLEHVVEFNFPQAADRYRMVASAMGVEVSGVADHEVMAALTGRIRQLRVQAGIGHSLSDLGIHREDISSLAAHAVLDACLATNPRPATRRDIESIYERAL